ncbi:hypothetical protein Cal6303_2045 [Calothrix sp. PCC 6303]|nr:hypothetical protein Cal6303_2045 [Calothrix sp. PCC 6303]
MALTFQCDINHFNTNIRENDAYTQILEIVKGGSRMPVI